MTLTITEHQGTVISGHITDEDGRQVVVGLGGRPLSHTGEWGYAQGTGTATVSVPDGARVLGIGAAAGAGGAALSIDGGNAIGILENGSLEIILEGNKEGPFNVMFDSTTHYLVDWVI